MIRIFDLFDYLQPRVTADWPDQHPHLQSRDRGELSRSRCTWGQCARTGPVRRCPPRALPTTSLSAIAIRSRTRAGCAKCCVPPWRRKGCASASIIGDFRLGAPLVVEMARAVEQSRYTLAVLSPAYLTSNFAELENVLAEHLGLEQGHLPPAGRHDRPAGRQPAPGPAHLPAWTWPIHARRARVRAVGAARRGAAGGTSWLRVWLKELS